MAKALKVEDELIVEKVSLLCFKNEVEIMIIGGVFFFDIKQNFRNALSKKLSSLGIVGRDL